jgi:uncharacterized protein (DUF779 family)
MKSPEYMKHKHTGIVTDLPEEEVIPENWTGGMNVFFQDGATKRVGGYISYTTTATSAIQTPPYFAMSVVFAGNIYWIYCGTNKVYVTDGTAHINITPSGGLTSVQPGTWTGTMLNGIPVINNGVDPPMYWDLDVGHKLAVLPGWPPVCSCRAIRAFKYHLFALNMTINYVNYPDTLWWSSAAEPGAIPQEWTPTTSNDAGDMVLADTSGIIVDGLGMRDSFVVYKDYSTYSISYVAGTFVYTVRKNFLSSGLKNLNCITEIDGYHWVFTGTDVITHDGHSSKSLIQYKVRDELVNSINGDKSNLCCVTNKISNNQLWICIPEQNKDWLSKAYLINTMTGEVGMRELPNVAYVTKGTVNPKNPTVTWESDTDVWDVDVTFWNQQAFSPVADTILYCDAATGAPRLWIVDTIDSADSGTITAYAERLSVPINVEEDVIIRRLVTRLVPRIEGQAGDTIMISVGGQSEYHSPIVWQTPQPYVIGTDYSISIIGEVRLISVRFEATTYSSWKIHSYMLEYVDAGLY